MQENHFHFVIPSYTLDGKQLTLCETEMDLGVVLNSNLTWVNQVNSVRYKAKKMLGFIRRSTKDIMKSEQERAFTYNWLATTLHMHLKYGLLKTIQWIENIEKVQRSATKYILNLGLPPMFHIQQDYFNLVYFYYHVGMNI